MTPDMTPASIAAPEGGALDTLLDVPMPVVIEIGRTRMTLREVLQLGTGSVVPLDRMVGDPVDIYVGERRLAQGEIVVIGEQFGVRVLRVLSGLAAEAA